MPEETQDKELQALNSKNQLNDDVKSFHNLSEVEQSELLGLLAQSQELNCEEIESKMGELSEYWGKILIEILNKNRLYKEESDRRIRVEKQTNKIYALQNLSKRVVRKGGIKLDWVSWNILELRWWENKDFKSFYPTYYYIWGFPINVREYDNYFNEKLKKYVITEEEIYELLNSINEYMKDNGAENDWNIDYKIKLKEWKTKILAWEYLIEVVPELTWGVITNDGGCRINDLVHGEFEFWQGGYKSYKVILKIPNEMMTSPRVRNAMLNNESVELF